MITGTLLLSDLIPINAPLIYSYNPSRNDPFFCDFSKGRMSASEIMRLRVVVTRVDTKCTDLLGGLTYLSAWIVLSVGIIMMPDEHAVANKLVDQTVANSLPN